VPIVKDWTMTAYVIKARELISGKLSTCVLPLDNMQQGRTGAVRQAFDFMKAQRCNRWPDAEYRWPSIPKLVDRR
jgi:hypothetical protein